MDELDAVAVGIFNEGDDALAVALRARRPRHRDPGGDEPIAQRSEGADPNGDVPEGVASGVRRVARPVEDRGCGRGRRGLSEIVATG